MTDNNHSAVASDNREFDLHLHILEHDSEGKALRYTIGVWEQAQGAVLRAICHIRSLSEALLAISKELDQRQQPEIEQATKAVNDSRTRAVRNRLPDERVSVTHNFSVAGHEGYITVGLYPDQQPGEVFITMAKEGSTVSGLVSSFAQALSIALQHGVPLELFCEKFAHTRFEPSGWTGNPELPNASSVMDYIFRWLHLRFIRKAPPHDLAVRRESRSSQALTSESTVQVASRVCLHASDAPSCRHCGAITKRNGSCYVCANCGASTGCS